MYGKTHLDKKDLPSLPSSYQNIKGYCLFLVHNMARSPHPTLAFLPRCRFAGVPKLAMFFCLDFWLDIHLGAKITALPQKPAAVAYRDFTATLRHTQASHIYTRRNLDYRN